MKRRAPRATGRAPADALPQDQLAQLAGVSEATWKVHKAQGAPTPRSKSDLASWLPRYHAWRKENGKGGAAAAAVAVNREGDRWTNERKKWLAMLARIEFGIRMRELVQRRDVVEFAGKAVLAVRQRLNDMVVKMASRLANQDEATVQEELQAEVDAICATFERGMEVPDEPHDATAPPGPGPGDLGELASAEEADGE